MTSMYELYELAKRRVWYNPKLAEYQDIILYDWPEGDEHWRWVLNSDANEIAEWAQGIREDENSM